MSFILQALKRAEEDRRADAAGRSSQPARPLVSFAPSRPLWPWVVTAALIVNVGAIGGVLFFAMRASRVTDADLAAPAATSARSSTGAKPGAPLAAPVAAKPEAPPAAPVVARSTAPVAAPAPPPAVVAQPEAPAGMPPPSTARPALPPVAQTPPAVTAAPPAIASPAPMTPRADATADTPRGQSEGLPVQIPPLRAEAPRVQKPPVEGAAAAPTIARPASPAPRSPVAPSAGSATAPAPAAPAPPIATPSSRAPVAAARPGGPSSPVSGQRAAVASSRQAADDTSPAAARLREVASNLKVEVLVWATNPRERMVFLNGRKYVEGQVVEGGAIIDQIAEDAVVLVHEGQRLRLQPEAK